MWPSVPLILPLIAGRIAGRIAGYMNDGENADIVSMTDIINIKDKHLSIVKSAISAISLT